MSARVLGGALCLLAVAIIVYGTTGLLRVWQVKREVQALEREIVSLRGETQELARTVDRLRSDPETTEKIAREELGFVRPGEKVLKFPSTPRGR